MRRPVAAGSVLLLGAIALAARGAEAVAPESFFLTPEEFAEAFAQPPASANRPSATTTAAGPEPTVTGDAEAAPARTRLPTLAALAETEAAPTAHSTPPAPQATALAAPERRRPDKAPAPPPAEVAPPIDLNGRTGLPPITPVQAWEATRDAPVPDRWRILQALDLVRENPLDPYNQNTLKGDKPVRGSDEFFIVTVTSDTIFEPRQVPTPVGPQGTTRSGSNGIFGGADQTVFAQTVILGLVYLKGDTTFRPPDWEYHFTPAFNFNQANVEEARALNVDPRRGRERRETFLGVQELFADYHLRNVGDRYDFDSFRIGIQPIQLDFRGFLFNDLPLSLRLFGNRDNNRWQYNLLWARRLEKDTNSGLNAINRPLRDDDLFAANLYRQDFPVLGFTSQALVAVNLNREGEDFFFNGNGFLERPASLGTQQGRDYEVTYLAYNGDGHFGRTNLTVSTSAVIGNESKGVFTGRSRRVLAGFAAAEASWDFDWRRLRLSGLWHSGDDDPYDDVANGYDAVFENPIFAGADTSYWIRQSIPLIGGGGVALSGRNGVLASLRTSIGQGQSNFTNPGLFLFGVGGDLDVLPQLRLTGNVNHLSFADTTTLEVARNQGPVRRDLGWDVSLSAIWRPFMTQNAVIRLSAAQLVPGGGFRDLFPDRDAYSILANLTFVY